MAGSEKFDLIVRARDEASRNLKSVATSIAGIVAAAQSLRMVTGFLKESSQAAIESEAVWNDLSASVERHGMVWAEVGDELFSFAGRLQRATGISDEAIAKSMQMFLDYGATASQAQRRVQVAADLAAGANMNLMSATDLVAKASVGYTSTLSRYGIILDESIPKAEKFEAAIAQINERFSGAAQAKMDATKGKLAELSEAFGDFQERLGEVVNKGLDPLLAGLTDTRNVLEELDPLFKEMIGNTEDWTPEIKKLADEFINLNPVLEGALALMRLGARGMVSTAEAMKELELEITLTEESYRDLSGTIDTSTTRWALMNLLIGEIKTSMQDLRTVAPESAQLAATAFGVTADEAKRIMDEYNLAMDAMRDEWAAERQRAIDDAQMEFDSFRMGFESTTARAIDNMVTEFAAGRASLADIFKGMAADFARFFLQEISAKLAASAFLSLFGGGPAAGGSALSALPIIGPLFGKPAFGDGVSPAGAGGNTYIFNGDFIGEEQYVRRRIVPVIERDATLQANKVALRT
jgi:hypothetical protein